MGRAGVSLSKLKTKQKKHLHKILYLTSSLDYLLSANVLIILDFCGSKCNSTTTGMKMQA